MDRESKKEHAVLIISRVLAVVSVLAMVTLLTLFVVRAQALA